MRVLLDTNIIIHREASKVVNQDIGILFNWLDKLQYIKCVHPLTIEELNRNINSETVKTMQAKLASYQILKTIAPIHERINQVCSPIDTTINDINDTKLLNELLCDRVDILISEDKKIHTKASLLNISERVFHIDSFLEKVVADNPELITYKVLSVKKEYFGNINLHDSFFDSFRADYPAFDKWFNGKAGNNDQAYAYYEDDILKAFLYLKTESTNESYLSISPSFTPKKRLKIGTFKVVSNGLRIGERFLKIVFDNARLYKVNEIYVTVFDNRPELLNLISLLEKFGFKYHGINTTTTEKVYTRNFEKQADEQNPRSTFPWLSKTSNVYMIPIKPEYHTELFPDSILRTESLDSYIDSQPHRNAISKSYISHSFTRSLKSGDIIVFYRSGGIYKGVATTIGIVENIISNIKNLDELVNICKKRTVLSESELKEYWERQPSNRPFVINFLYAFSFIKRITLKQMLDAGILPSMDSVKTITKMERDSLVKLITLAGI